MFFETVLITGGTGLVGRNLSKSLKEKGYRVSILARKKLVVPGVLTYHWDVDRKEIEEGAIETADVIIHLAGANIGEKRWTAKRRRLISDSRTLSGELIFEKVSVSAHKPKVFISASAVGYYGAVTNKRIYSEEDPPQNDFVGNVCKSWEKAADKFETLGIRTVKIRTGVVLSKKGGALAKMSIPARMGIGSAMGSGKQYMPWIHIDDLCRIYVKAVGDVQMRGAFNAVAPEHTTNKDFMAKLSRALNRPFWFPGIPSFVLKLIFGKMSSMFLKGSRISSKKITQAGFQFKFPGLESALADIIKKD